jgi:septal ring-binding cell division protein DamX
MIRQSAVPKTVLTVAAMAALLFATAGTDYTNGMTLFAQGKPDKAAAAIKRARALDTADVAIQYAYASICVNDLGRNRRLLEALAADTATPDSITVAALARLGDLDYCAKAYDSASRHFGLAAARQPTDALHYRYARAAFMAGQPARADSLWRVVSRCRDTALAKRAAARLSLPLAQQPERTDTVLNFGAALGDPPKAPTDSLRRYTLQLGAFSSDKNAKKLATELSNEYDSVSVVKIDNNGTTIYRVRVGVFASETEADLWAKRNLGSRNLSFRVVTR